ncbi:MAG: M14 family metallopeptidase, partial [Thermoflexibacter sp.]|nr:M14 family metallopeptidase [Thermoflexibacter sp.]
MRKITLLLFFAFLQSLITYGQELSYYLPDSVTYNPAIPTPESVIGHKVGQWHITHDKLVYYMRELAKSSDRIKIEQTGKSHEDRPQILLTITSAKNHANLEQIRQQHLELSNPSKSASLIIDNMPVVVWQGYSIHGNEPSGVNAALLHAYYLAAAQGKSIDDLLDNTVILLDPAFNPDGINRFAHWANMHKSKHLVTDPQSREFNEVWPGGRFNHYWFDLNRDWLPAQHPESQNRLKKFHEWRPNILTDHHEMGSNSTFFFQPGVPARTNPLTPAKNQELTGKIGKFHATFLDRIGSLYYSKEGFDDFYYGKGSTYPDIHGAVGILFEQGSSRGHAQETINGILTFPFTIRNQFTTSLSTLEAAKNLRKELLNFQRESFQTALQQANASPIKGYIVGDKNDKAKTYHFLELLERHQIEVYELKGKINVDNQEFESGSAFIIPTNQTQYRLITTIFQKETKFKDSLFYDVSAWTMPLAFNLPYGEIKSLNSTILGSKVSKANFPTGEVVGGKSEYAYLLEWDEYYAPKLAYEVLASGLIAKVATDPFEIITANGAMKFDYGTIMIPTKNQVKSPEEIYQLIDKQAKINGLKVYAVKTGQVIDGIDLGSNSFSALEKPRVAMIVGAGVAPSDAGEIWHLADQRFGMPISQIDVNNFNGANLDKYNTLLMVSGSYNSINKDKVKAWVQNGGTLVLFENAIQWGANGLVTINFKKAKTDSMKVV